MPKVTRASLTEGGPIVEDASRLPQSSLHHPSAHTKYKYDSYDGVKCALLLSINFNLNPYTKLSPDFPSRDLEPGTLSCGRHLLPSIPACVL
jgi:hypothetical protein